MAADFLTLADITQKITSATVRKYLDDALDGDLANDDATLQDFLHQAEGEYYNRMLRAYSDTTALIELAANDEALTGHIAWIACELISERRIEFTDADGWGAYKAQYERATAYIDRLSKGLSKSKGQAAVGAGRTSGGRLQPKPPAGTSANFVFAPSRKAPSGHGGF